MAQLAAWGEVSIVRRAKVSITSRNWILSCAWQEETKASHPLFSVSSSFMIESLIVSAGRLFMQPFASIAARAMCVAALMGAVAVADSDRPMTVSKFDPNAKQVEMFTAMEEGSIEVKLVAKDSTGGNLFIKNKTSEPLTVKAPDSFVAVPIHAQFGGGMGGMGGGMGGMGGGMGGMGGGMGGGMQSMGGGMGGMGGGMGGMGGGMGGMGGGMGGGGFFSIPPEKTLRVHYTSVCLNHGLAEPTPRASYKIIPVEKYTDNPVLVSLINMVGTGRLDQHSAQAATWNIANGMSWAELAAKSTSPVPTPGTRYFSPVQMQAAQTIVAMAHAKAMEDQESEPAATPTNVRRRVR
jgi:hypothetical protein